jgi:hypothetical protein
MISSEEIPPWETQRKAQQGSVQLLQGSFDLLTKVTVLTVIH